MLVYVLVMVLGEAQPLEGGGVSKDVSEVEVSATIFLRASASWWGGRTDKPSCPALDLGTGSCGLDSDRGDKDGLQSTTAWSSASAPRRLCAGPSW